MRQITGLLLAIIALLSPVIVAAGGDAEQPTTAIQANNGETRTITDHFGHTVEIPAEAKRIASLAGPVSVMLIELGIGDRIIGIATRVKMPENRSYIRGVEELFNIKLENTNYVNYGRKDVEQVKLSKPDLIIGSEINAAQYEIFSSIAPTIVISTYSLPISQDIFKVYGDLAAWVREEKVFNTKYQQYKDRIATVQNQYLSSKTIAYIEPQVQKSKMDINLRYGSFTRVLYDIKLQPSPFLLEHFKDGSGWTIVSPEIIGEFSTTDYLLATYRNQHGETVQTIYDELDIIAPGWRSMLRSYISFTSCNYIIDEFVKYIKY